jgi:hypothetical protein
MSMGDILARILGGCYTPLFLCNTQFYFPLSSLLLHKCHKRRRTYIVRDSSVGSLFAYSVGSWGLIPSEVIFFNHHVRMTLASKFFTDFYLFPFSVLFITFVFFPVNFITVYIKHILWILKCSTIIYYLQL